MSLSAKTIAVIKATAPVVAPHATTITTAFYKKMFSRHPEMFQFFNKANQAKGKQPHALSDAVIAYASNIDNLGSLGPAVSLMAVKHCALQVQPAHYQVVHDLLMETIGDVLGGAVTPEIGAGWSEAVMFLAGVLIGEEKKLYDAAAARSGGWRGWKEFVLASKRPLNSKADVYQFFPKCGSNAKFDFTPGQYLTLKTNLKDKAGDFVAPRHYTVASTPGRPYLEIAVKAIPGGIVSNHLHDNLKEGDTVELSPPFGDFTLKQGSDPVLLSAGIGITPMMAFGKQLLREDKHDVVHVHVDGSEDIPWRFAYYPRGDLKLTVRKTTSTDIPSLDELHKLTGDVSKKDVYICGPDDFMKATVPYFRTKARSVTYEDFGPRVKF